MTFVSLNPFFKFFFADQFANYALALSLALITDRVGYYPSLGDA